MCILNLYQRRAVESSGLEVYVQKTEAVKQLWLTKISFDASLSWKSQETFVQVFSFIVLEMSKHLIYVKYRKKCYMHRAF